jgi:archaellum biogenesis protein FlaJ (TadC family)
MGLVLIKNQSLMKIIKNIGCLKEDIHKLFHKYYGYGNNTMEQWNEFVKKYNNNQYKLIA